MDDLKQFGIATKAIILKDDKYLILYKSDKEDVNPNSYDIPGGRLQFGEQPEEALTREVKEEVGLDIAILGPFEVWTFTKENFQLVGVNFLCKYLGGSESLSDEHDHFKWLSIHELDKTYPEWILKTIQKADEFKKNLNIS